MHRWKDIPDYNGRYQISDHGEVRRFDGRPIKTRPHHKTAYIMVSLFDPPTDKYRTFLVHRLVATAFVENPLSKPTVNHIDCDRSNNVWSNLEWCTQGENNVHAVKHGSLRLDYWRGKRGPKSILSDGDVRSIRALYATGTETQEGLGARFGCSDSTIERVVTGKSYRHVSAAPPAPSTDGK